MNTFLFFDDFMLDHSEGIRKRHFTPRRTGVFQPEGISAGSSLVHGREGGRYILYYSSIKDMSRDWDREILYATGSDGVNFTPAGRIDDIRRTGSLFVNRDTHENNPARRYKAVVMKMDKDADNRGYGCVIASRDGIHWDTDTPWKVMDHPSDTSNNVFYNPVLGKYQVICRGGFIDRRITSYFSKDLETWSDPVLLLAPTPFDEPFTQYYGMTVFPMDGMFLGFLQLYRTDPRDTVWSKMAGKVDCALVYSYNGIVWNRASRDVLIPRPAPPEFGSSCLYLSNMVETPSGDEWIIASSGSRADHGCGFAPAYPGWEYPQLAKDCGNWGVVFHGIRKHGFTALESFSRTASLRFKGMHLTGDDLHFNLSCPAGYVKFRVLDESYAPYPGFGYEESIPFTGDSLKVVPRWKDKDMRELRGRRIFLELEIQNCLLYSMEGDLHPYHAAKPYMNLGFPLPMTEET
ncbi:MAG: hypothetical protein R6W96_01030 [Clostridia bacterium]